MAYYWEAHRRAVVGNRLAWFAVQAEEQFWYDYWNHEVSVTYYQSVRNRNLSEDELGRILIQEMSLEGRHLEAGCGAGQWVAALLSANYSVLGIEYSMPLVKRVNEVEPSLPVQFGNALHLDFADETFDTYLSFGVVEHVRSGPQPFLREAYRILKPGGKIIISVPFFGFVRRAKSILGLYGDEPPNLEFFQYGFQKSEFGILLREAGFQTNYARPLYISRMLIEEVLLYRKLLGWHGTQYWMKLAQICLGKIDGHMLLYVGQKDA